MTRFRGSACASVALLVLGAPLLAQERPAVDARLSVVGGTATDARGTTSSAVTVAPAVSIAAARSALTLGGNLTRFGDAGWAAGGGASLAARSREARGAAFALDAGAALTRTSFDATFTTMEVAPALTVQGGPAAARAGAFVGVRAAAGRTRTTTAAPLPGPIGGPRPGAGTTTAQRTSFGPAFGASVTLAPAELAAAGGALRLAYREEHARLTGGELPRVTERALVSTLARGPLTLSGSLGARRAAGGNATFGGGALAIALGRAVVVEGAAGSYPSNVLTGTAGGRYASVGFALRTGRPRAAAPAVARPRGVPAPRKGTTRLAIEAPDAGRVEVAGDWNGWHPVPATRAPNGVWYADLTIPPGRYRYAFRVDGRRWDVPKGAAAVDDDFGGRSAWLDVR